MKELIEILKEKSPGAISQYAEVMVCDYYFGIIIMSFLVLILIGFLIFWYKKKHDYSHERMVGCLALSLFTGLFLIGIAYNSFCIYQVKNNTIGFLIHEMRSK